MYSGTTLNKKSGHFLGVHQKIDRIAWAKLKATQKNAFFPDIKNILHFEGKNGPDGIKRKNPGSDEPWHFIDPDAPDDTNLLELIRHHHMNLSQALQLKDEHRSAFEAAWLAHAVADGLTPAHHYPLEEKLEQIRGEGLQTRTSLRKKIVLPGKTPRQKLRNNWEFWGAHGVMTSHYLFEWGVAGAMSPLSSNKISLRGDDIKTVQESGYETIFRRHLAEIAALKMYDTFCHKGWTSQLARQTRRELMPLIVQSVTLAWLGALPGSQR